MQLGQFIDSVRPHPGRWLVKAQRNRKQAVIFPSLFRNVGNWLEIWRARDSQAMPPLQMRHGATIYHTGAGIEVLCLIQDIYQEEVYRIGLPKDVETSIVDIGANVGFASLYLLERFPRSVVHAYEPNLHCFEILRRNMSANGFDRRVQLWNEAVGRSAGTIRLTSTGASTLLTAVGAPDHPAIVVTAQMVDLQQVVERRRVRDRKIDLLKIDVEGAEVDILEGASDSVLHLIRNFIIEYHDAILPGAKLRCVARLQAAGFKCGSRPDPRQPGIGMLYAGENCGN